MQSSDSPRPHSTKQKRLSVTRSSILIALTFTPRFQDAWEHISFRNLVSGNRGGGNRTTLLATVVSISPIYLNFDMSEADYLTFT